MGARTGALKTNVYKETEIVSRFFFFLDSKLRAIAPMCRQKMCEWRAAPTAIRGGWHRHHCWNRVVIIVISCADRAG